MKVIEKLLLIVLIISLIIVFINVLKCVIPRISFKENFDNMKFCDSIYTNKDTEVLISSNKDKYMNIDKNSSKNNIQLQTVPSNKSNNWKFEKVINDSKDCSVYIKTEYEIKNSNSKIYYYLTKNKKDNFIPGIGNNYVSSSLFGKGENQMWYVIDIALLPENKFSKIKNTIQNAKIKSNDKVKYVFITTNLNYFKENAKNDTYFLASNSYDSTGAVTLSKHPIVESVWKTELVKKGKFPVLPKFKPTEVIGSYPNKEKSDHGSFMPSYLSLWNNDFYSSGKNNKLQKITISLKQEGEMNEGGEFIVNNTYATGTVKLDNNYSGTLKNAVYDVKTYGDDMLFGEGQGPEKENKIIIKLLPKNKKPAKIPDGIPIIQGWIEKPSVDNKVPNIISITSSNHNNFSGVALALGKDRKFLKHLISKDMLPVKSNINFNLSKNLYDSVENFSNLDDQCIIGNINKCLR